MNKDYLPSAKYTKEELDRLDVPYVLNDFCVDELADYMYCKRYKGTFLDNRIFYNLPYSSSYTMCGGLQSTWNKCQDKREREIFEQITKVYKERYQKSLEENRKKLSEEQNSK